VALGNRVLHVLDAALIAVADKVSARIAYLDGRVLAFSDLIGRAAAWFDALATHVPRAAQNRRTGNGALRVRAAECLPGVFRKRLGQPHHARVATIATIVSGIKTDAVRSWHIPRRLIRQTIDEAIERGLIEERRSGWRLSYAKSMPNTYRLTFRPTREGTPPQWKPPTNEWRRYRSPKNVSNGSEVAPGKYHNVNRLQRSSVPHRELVKVPHRTPPSIFRAEGGGEGRGVRRSRSLPDAGNKLS